MKNITDYKGVITMRKTNKSFTLTLSVDYMPIHTDGDSLNAMALADDDIYAIDWLHEQGYKACIKGNILTIYRDYGWAKVENHYAIIPNVHYYNYRENRNYNAIIDAAKRLALAHTLAIVRKINAGR